MEGGLLVMNQRERSRLVMMSRVREKAMAFSSRVMGKATGADIRGAIVWGVAADTVWEGMPEAGDRDCAGKFSPGQRMSRAQTWGISRPSGEGASTGRYPRYRNGQPVPAWICRESQCEVRCPTQKVGANNYSPLP